MKMSVELSEKGMVMDDNEMPLKKIDSCYNEMNVISDG